MPNHECDHTGQWGVVKATNDVIRLIGLECGVIQLDNEGRVVRNPIVMV